MQWRTRIEIDPLGVRIDHRTSIMMLGSCFTDEIGGKLTRQMFDVAVNPMGTLFNPVSIADAITDALDERRFGIDELMAVDGTWRTFRRHSRFALPDREATLQLLDDNLATARKRIADADVMIITFGSAMVHRHIPSSQIVANCHKQPSSLFKVEMLTIDDIVGQWLSLIKRLREINPRLKLIFTVSPVRHSGYGLQRDRLSKSILIVAANRLAREKDTYYFPSYEIFVDDLRDYRWYDDDMVHPSAKGVEYTYELFREATMDKGTIALADKWGKLTQRLEHRSLNPDTVQIFHNATMQLAADLAKGDKVMAGRFDSYQRNLCKT